MVNLRMLTYNIHKGFSPGNRRFVLHELRSALEIADVELVFLQEIQGEHQKHRNRIDGWPKESQFEFLAEGLWPHYTYGKNAVYKAGHHGNAILSKYPFKAIENINVAYNRWASRSLLHGTIEVPALEAPLHVICIHLGLAEAEREEQLAILSQRINAHVPHDEPLLIAGDFNDWRQRAEYHLHEDLGLQEVFAILKGRHAKTFPIWWPLLSVDRIYFRSLEPKGCSCLTGDPWRKLSDHAPLYAEFEIDRK